MSTINKQETKDNIESVNNNYMAKIFRWVLRKFKYVQELESDYDEIYNKLQLALSGDITLETMRVDSKGMSASISTKMAGYMAGIFKDTLNEMDAENYIEMQFMDPESQLPITVTIKRHDGKTPHQLRIEAEEKLKKLEHIMLEVKNKD